MPTCGNCHQVGQTVAHIRGCYGQRYTTVKTRPAQVDLFTVEAELVVTVPATVAPAVVKMADFDTVPAAKYVATMDDGGLIFIEVQRATKGKWAGRTFVKHLIGAPGDWRRAPMNLWSALPLMTQIAADPKAAALAYSTHFTTCSRCDAPLSDVDSRARGLGPDCVKHFAGV